MDKVLQFNSYFKTCGKHVKSILILESVSTTPFCNDAILNFMTSHNEHLHRYRRTYIQHLCIRRMPSHQPFPCTASRCQNNKTVRCCVVHRKSNNLSSSKFLFCLLPDAVSRIIFTVCDATKSLPRHPSHWKVE